MEVKIVKEKGTNKISVDGKTIDSLAFKSFRPTPNNVGDFYKAGVRIFHLYCSGLRSGIKMPYSLYGENWFGIGDYRFEGFDRQMEMFLSAAPDGYFFINLHLDTREWWLEQNPENADSFTHLSQIAANEKWRQDTKDYINAFIRYAEAKYGDKILGYWLLGGYTTEWFSFKDREETHPVKLAAFRKYLRDENAVIPTLEERTKPKEQIFLDPVTDEKLIKYRRFHAELISGLVLDFCKAAKEATGGKKLVGLFFGYIMELGSCVWQWGHLDLDRVNESPYVDMIATPSSYQFRNYDDGTAYMILTESVKENGKLYFASFDNLTFLTPTMLKNERRLCNDPETEAALKSLVEDFKRTDLLDTREKTIHGMRREMMSRLYRQCGTWWFDMLEGWYYDNGLMEEVKALTEKSRLLCEKSCSSAAEICIFVGAEPLYYVNPASDIHTQTVTGLRGELGKIGAPYDLYSLKDLEKADREKYKLFIFLNAFSLNDRQRAYINRELKRDGRSLFFVGAPDYIDNVDINPERSFALLEMKGRVLKEPKNPTFFIEDEGVQNLGCLTLKEREDYRIFYSAQGNIPNATFREAAKISGVHIYAENGTFTYINDLVAGIYNTLADKTEIILKEDGEYTELFSGKVYKTRDKKITLPTGECPAQMLVLK